MPQRLTVQLHLSRATRDRAAASVCCNVGPLTHRAEYYSRTHVQPRPPYTCRFEYNTSRKVTFGLNCPFGSNTQLRIRVLASVISSLLLYSLQMFVSAYTGNSVTVRIIRDVAVQYTQRPDVTATSRIARDSWTVLESITLRYRTNFIGRFELLIVCRV